jgi:RNA methyltransferase, TrmH family
VLSPGDVALLHRARRDPGLVLLEGVHALKHAVRFGADVLAVASPDPDALAELLARTAPDVALPDGTGAVESDTWRALTQARVLPSPCLAVARRPEADAARMVARPSRLLLLEQPRHLGNVGAVVRVAAAASLAGVVVIGELDPWHPTVVRAAAGLHFAVDVLHLADPAALDVFLADDARPRPVVALDPAGEDLERFDLPPRAVIALGTERGGLSADLLDRATARIAIPMQPGVSSLNLATAAAVVAYRP